MSSKVGRESFDALLCLGELPRDFFAGMYAVSRTVPLSLADIIA